MKFDDNKPLSSQKNKQSITPQSAMDAYFDDMFGSAEEDPLKKLAAQDHDPKSTGSINKNALHKTNKSKVDESKANAVSRSESSALNEPKPKLHVKKQAHIFSLPPFEEPEINISNISPLIIPAAFPKLAPVVTEAKPVVTDAKPVEKVITKTEIKLEIPLPAVKPNVKTKLDVKTALAILEKEKSKLSTAQRQRLKEKLRLLSDAKSKVLSQAINKTEVAEKKETATPVARVVTAKSNVSQKVELKVDVKQPSISAPVGSLAKQPAPVSVKASATTLIESPNLSVQKNTRPDWANNRFECLIFSVAGLKLAVPLISLGAIYKIEKGFIPLVGRANWFMGLYHHLERNVRVIDTAQWVMPERCSAEVRASYKFIIRLGGNDWGMACDAVHQSIQLYPDQVKWRTERTKRAWLFGTVIDHMCALIDADSLSALLNQQATKNPKIFS